ncbi:MAG: M3 family metallopeptidase, partial [Desulfobacteraceae bacterium]|nr:M3 family metallopeptidase [Desulfobacteraceae bacterium]
VFKNILNALLLAYHQEDVERGHPFPMHRIHLSNEVNESIIENMLGVVEGYYPLARRYLREKARCLGLGKLKNTDIFAPLKEENFLVSFSDATKLISEAAENLHPVFHSFVREIFENNRIDAGVRAGKQNGAFCKSLEPSLHPYISMSYAGNISDLMTLAHELGHGIHYRLCSEQTYVNFDPPPILAEAASTFMEMVVIEYLMEKKGCQKLRPDLLALQIEGIMTTVFRQNVLTRFEQVIHNKRRDHLLSAREICRLWWDENNRFYGEEVEMTPGYRWGWTYIPHFFHRPFYCYSYIFGNLLSIMLFQNYQEKGDGFLETVIDLLKTGSSRPPIEMIKEMGLDIGKRCWEPAFQYIEDLIDSWEASPKA